MKGVADALTPLLAFVGDVLLLALVVFCALGIFVRIQEGGVRGRDLIDTALLVLLGCTALTVLLR